MARPVINVLVKGGSSLSQQKNTVILKPDVDIAEQMSEKNVRYIVKWDFDISERTYESDVTTSGSVTIDGVNYSYATIEAIVNQHVEILDKTLKFVRNGVILVNKAIDMLAGESVVLCSLATGEHENGIRCTNKTVQVPYNCELSFEGGSISGGGIFLDKTRILPLYNDLTNEYLAISGIPSSGTMWWNEKLLISDGESWLDCMGNSPETEYETTET